MKRVFRDQMGRVVTMMGAPKRIISLVPSQTELLFDLGLDTEVVGITKFCVHPENWYLSKERIGGTKHINLEKVKKLNPDLIIGNKEENTKEDISALEQIAPVWMSDINSYEEAILMIQSVGEIVKKENRAKEIITNIHTSFEALKIDRRRKAIYFIWKDPDYVAGKKTFIDSILEKAGFDNCIAEIRYPELNQLDEIDPEIVFLSTEPFPFNSTHKIQYEKKFPNSLIQLVDGEMFSWYGSRMLYAPEYFQELINDFTQK